MDLSPILDQASDLLNSCPASEWELVGVSSDRLSMLVSGRELDKFSQSSSQGLALRVIHQGSLGFSYLIGNDASALPQMVKEALASAQNSDLRQECCLAPALDKLPEVNIFDPKVLEEPLEEKRNRALTMAEAAFGADPKIVHVHPAEVEQAISQTWIRTSNGLDASYSTTQVGAGCVAMAAEGEEQEAAWESHAGRFLAELDPEAIGRKAGRSAADSLGGAPEKDGRYEVLLDNRISAQFLDLLGASFMGDNVLKGRSLMADKMGREVMSPLIDIIDDGLYPRGLGTSPWDSEGTPQKSNTLLRSGKVAGFVYDRYWASRAGVESTGNSARASIKAPPQVGYCNLHITPGDLSPQEAMTQMGRGILITDTMGGHTADPVSGEFSFGASGYLIENGRISRPVKSMAMAGQVVDLFKAAKAVCSDLRFFGTTGAPSLWVSGISLSGA